MTLLLVSLPLMVLALAIAVLPLLATIRHGADSVASFEAEVTPLALRPLAEAA